MADDGSMSVGDRLNIIERKLDDALIMRSRFMLLEKVVWGALGVALLFLARAILDAVFA
jgi:hypothetical protein